MCFSSCTIFSALGKLVTCLIVIWLPVGCTMKKYLSQAMRRMEKEEKKTQVDWIAPISLHKISWRKEHHFLTVFTLLVNMPCSGRGSNSWWGCRRGWGAWRRSRGGCQTPPGLQWICFALSASPEFSLILCAKLLPVNCILSTTAEIVYTWCKTRVTIIMLCAVQ